MKTENYSDRCQKPIPIGVQRYAYQCENIALEPIHGAISIRGYIPFKGGKEPYPNDEKDVIEYYDLRIERFTSNAIEVSLLKRFKDGTEYLYLTNVSFSDLANRIFEGNPANHWFRPAPKKEFLPSPPKD